MKFRALCIFVISMALSGCAVAGKYYYSELDTDYCASRIDPEVREQCYDRIGADFTERPLQSEPAE